MSTMVDSIVSVVWQHDGLRFKARALFSSGLVSGLSDPLEPQIGFIKQRLGPGEGAYDAPGQPDWQLLVGRLPVLTGARLAVPSGDRQLIQQLVNPFLARDFLGRPALFVRSYEGGAEFAEVRFLPEDWVGSSWTF